MSKKDKKPEGACEMAEKYHAMKRAGVPADDLISAGKKVLNTAFYKELPEKCYSMMRAMPQDVDIVLKCLNHAVANQETYIALKAILLDEDIPSLRETYENFLDGRRKEAERVFRQYFDTYTKRTEDGRIVNTLYDWTLDQNDKSWCQYDQDGNLVFFTWFMSKAPY